MIKTFAILTACAALASPAFAGDRSAGLTGGVFGGAAHSTASGGSFAASGGIASNGNGGSFVRNEQSAGQMAGAFGSYEGATNGRLTKGTVVTETFTDGFSQSRTITRDHGTGTIGAGAGFSTNWGSAEAAGGFVGGGFATNW